MVFLAGVLLGGCRRQHGGRSFAGPTSELCVLRRRAGHAAQRDTSRWLDRHSLGVEALGLLLIPRRRHRLHGPGPAARRPVADPWCWRRCHGTCVRGCVRARLISDSNGTTAQRHSLPSHGGRMRILLFLETLYLLATARQPFPFPFPVSRAVEKKRRKTGKRICD